MASSQNHIIDPTYFDDALAWFSFPYDAYIVKNVFRDDYGHERHEFEKTTIVGSLQSQGKSIQQSTQGNKMQWAYNFYCKSKYRIDIGDFLVYKHKLLHVDSIQDYDEWGVRSCHLTMVSLSAYKDLMEYIKYLTGEAAI